MSRHNSWSGIQAADLSAPGSHLKVNGSMFSSSSALPSVFGSQPQQYFYSNTSRPLVDTPAPVADFDVGVFSTGKVTTNGCTRASSSATAGLRETGIIEKMLPTFGFIQCCDRQARLFFHFSQFDGNIEHLRVGDPVEFEMTYDRRNGKPIASSVTKITPETPQLLSEERVTGRVTSELKLPPHAQQGRISYENRGECFFLPFGADDVEGNVTINVGDLVSFQMASDPRNGNLVAHNVRLENPANPIEYRGVVCAIHAEQRRGVIERADVVREIVFSFTDLQKSYVGGVNLGDEVQFNIHTVHGKEVATNISLLEPGSVVFEDVDPALCKGQVQKALDSSITDKHALTGRIRFKRPSNDVVDVTFGERDMKGHFTLRHGDLVQFNVATDRRNRVQRATNICLLEESFRVSDERREQGVLLSIKEHLYGFIRCVERDQNLFFHLSEMIEPERGLQIRDELEFTVVSDAKQSGRLTAVRVQRLPAGSVVFEERVEEAARGQVCRVAGNEPGLISWQNTTVSYRGECKNRLRVGDTVQMDVMRCRRTRQLLAANINVLQRAAVAPTTTDQQPANSSSGDAASQATQAAPQCHGYVAALKDGFGFIETMQHDCEVFFHFSSYGGDVDELRLGCEVQYQMTRTGQRWAATEVQLLPEGTLPAPHLLPDVLEGIVLRPMRCVDPEQNEYPGLVQLNTTDEVAPAYNFGITSLFNKKEYLQTGDMVTFQLDENSTRAYNMRVQRERLRALVDSVKGQYGFLDHETDEGKKLFFHVSEVEAGVSLHEGDEVEFSVVHSQRSGRSSACHIFRVASGSGGGKTQRQRPERVIQRIRQLAVSDRAAVQRVQVIRQPRGPDPNTRGFALNK